MLTNQERKELENRLLELNNTPNWTREQFNEYSEVFDKLAQDTMKKYGFIK